VRAGLHVQADVVEARLQRALTRGEGLVDGAQVVGAADRLFEYALVVDQHHDPMRRVHPVDVARAGEMEVADVEDVFPVGGEVVLHHHAAARAERQTFDMRALVVAGLAIRAAARLDLGAADGLARDVARRGDVLLEETRTDLQGRRDVVEAVAAHVPRQDRALVDVDAEQAFDRPRVFSAVQPVQHHRAGIRVAGRGGIEPALHPGDEIRNALAVRLLFAGRGHQPAAQLAYRVLPSGGVLRRRFDGQRVEGDAAGPVRGVVALAAVAVDEVARGLLRILGGRRDQRQHEQARQRKDTTHQTIPGICRTWAAMPANAARMNFSGSPQRPSNSAVGRAASISSTLRPSRSSA
jgi:hypothetical protein